MGQKGSTGVSRGLGHVAIRGNYGRSDGVASRNDKDERHASLCNILPKSAGTLRYTSGISSNRLCCPNCSVPPPDKIKDGRKKAEEL